MLPKDLAQFKKLLLARRNELSRGVAPPANEDAASVDESALAPASPTPAATNAPASALLKAFDAALARIEDGTYGVCASCGREIGSRRLVAFPWATLCLPCQATTEKKASGF